MDVSQDTVTENTLLNTYTAHKSDGTPITGTYNPPTIVVSDTQDSAGGTIRSITTTESPITLQSKVINDGNKSQIVRADDGFTALNEVVINGREDLVEPKDVDVIDYDGRLLYSYTAQEFLTLTELPSNPTNPGLIAQGWNWTLADAKEYVQQWGALVIGQNYTTDTGETRIYITIPEIFVQRNRQLQFTPYALSSVKYTIDWGDGTAVNTVNKTSTAAAGANSPKHTYQNAGDYIIRVTVVSGELVLGPQGVNNNTLGDSFYDYYKNGVETRIEIGNGVTKLGRQPFNRMRNLKAISIPITCNDMDTTTDIGMFAECCKLKGVVFPPGMIGRDKSLFDSSVYSLRYVSVPKTMSRFQISTSRSLRKLTLPPQSPVINSSLNVKMYNSGSLTHLIIPGTYTNIQDDTLEYSYITKLVIPESVTSLSGNMTFSHNEYLEELHMRGTTPPSLGAVGCFSGNTNMIIYVPYSTDHSVLQAYQAATNWSSYADRMQEEPQS